MKNKIYRFLDSELDEADYFSLSKENLISLKEYLQIINEKENEFKERISDYKGSIKDKFDWVEDVIYTGVEYDQANSFIISSIRLEGENNSLEAFYNKSNDKYITYPSYIPKLLCFTKRSKEARKNIQIVESIQNELSYIDDIGKLVFSGFLSNKSISGKFDLELLPFEGLVLNNNFSTLAFYGDNKPKYISEEVLKDTYKEKALSKILIKK